MGVNGKKLIEVVRWHFAKRGGQKGCIECRRTTSGVNLKPKCERGEKCKDGPPLILEENRQYFHLFSFCDSQVRATMGAIIGLDWNIVLRMADDMKVITDRLFYRLLRVYESIMAEELNRKENVPPSG